MEKISYQLTRTQNVHVLDNDVTYIVLDLEFILVVLLRLFDGLGLLLGLVDFFLGFTHFSLQKKNIHAMQEEIMK
jgi:hypothetical protein